MFWYDRRRAYTLAGGIADAMPLLVQAVEQETARGRVDTRARYLLSLFPTRHPHCDRRDPAADAVRHVSPPLTTRAAHDPARDAGAYPARRDPAH
jgi:hypothetical protein